MKSSSLTKEEIKRQRDELKIKMGKILSKARKTRKISVEKIAQLLGVSKQTVHNQEGGITQIMPDQLELLSEFYELPMSYFYGQSEYDSKTMIIAKEIASLPEELVLSYIHMIQLQKRLLNEKKLQSNKPLDPKQNKLVDFPYARSLRTN